MSFEFQLVLTEKCNLACKYCYMKKQQVDMSQATFDNHFKMLPDILSYYQQHNYNAALFGGEPLLNWELIEYITPILNSDKKCASIIMMTNGLLLKDEYKRKFIEKNNISISLSFDGLWNKENRPLANGESSLDKYLKDPLYSYFKNKHGCKVMVSPDSVPTLVENFKWFVEDYGIINPDFTLVRDDIWDNESIDMFETEVHKLADVVIEYFKNGTPAIAGFFQLYILDLLFGESFGKRPFGCFAGCHGAGFMPNGKVYPCARFGSNDILPIYDSNTGMINENNIKLMNNSNITNPVNYEKCKKCTLFKYCNAGCTFSQLKNYMEPLDSICKLFHICYSEAIRITNELKDNKLFRDIIVNSIKNVG